MYLQVKGFVKGKLLKDGEYTSSYDDVTVYVYSSDSGLPLAKFDIDKEVFEREVGAEVKIMDRFDLV